MKKFCVILLAALLTLPLWGCGKKDTAAEPTATVQPEAQEQVLEVKITPENLYDYFEYREYPTYYKNENGDITSVQIAYGFALKEGYRAENNSQHTDTMSVTFTADGVVNSGSFDVDFSTCQYTGTVADTQRETVSQTLKFWAKGDRTIVWNFGVYSDSYINYLENFTVTAAQGKVYLIKE